MRKKKFKVKLWEWCCLNGEVVHREEWEVRAKDLDDLYRIMDREIQDMLDGYDYDPMPDGTYLVNVGDHQHQVGYDVVK